MIQPLQCRMQFRIEEAFSMFRGINSYKKFVVVGLQGAQEPQKLTLVRGTLPATSSEYCVTLNLQHSSNLKLRA